MMFEIASGSNRDDLGGAPAPADVIAWYTKRAPDILPPVETTHAGGSGSLRLQERRLRIGGLDPFPGVANVRFVRLLDPERLDLLITDMRTGSIFVVRPYLERQAPKLLGVAKHPCSSEVVDLDRDGHLDLRQANVRARTVRSTS